MTVTRRYFLVRIVSQRPVSGEQFGTALTNSIRRHFGELGLCRIDPKLIRFDEKESRAVVACRKEGASEMEAAIGLISDVSGAAIAPITMKMSGTIKGLSRKH
jgi:RNase P/RNase MRP subunit POP5